MMGRCCPIAAIAPNWFGHFELKKKGHSLWMRMLFDDLVGEAEDRLRDRQTERLGSL